MTERKRDRDMKANTVHTSLLREKVNTIIVKLLTSH